MVLPRFVVAGVVVFGIVSAGSTAFAQASRTWVSGVGDDVNPCSRTAPCKTFAGAIVKTAAGGEIDALDPGGFGAVTITKSITLDGHQTLASILVNGTNGIIVNAGATDTVVLRGLNITCASPIACPTTSGVKYVAGQTLELEDVNINNFGGAAVDFQPAARGPLLLVKRLTATGNSGTGIIVGMAGQATISKSNFFHDGTGLLASETALVSVFDSVFAGSAIGVRAKDTAEINVNRGLISGNALGVQGDSIVRLSDAMIGHNTTGLAGAHVISFGNNRVTAGNATDGAPSSTLPQQ